MIFRVFFLLSPYICERRTCTYFARSTHFLRTHEACARIIIYFKSKRIYFFLYNTILLRFHTTSGRERKKDKKVAIAKMRIKSESVSQVAAWLLDENSTGIYFSVHCRRNRLQSSHTHSAARHLYLALTRKKWRRWWWWC